jgi:hypothetical protein
MINIQFFILYYFTAEAQSRRDKNSAPPRLCGYH